MITVLANGCWDILHYGHILHLRAAKRMGDRLVVSVTDDAHVNKFGRPIYTEWERAAILSELRCVDSVIIVPGLLEALQRIKPNIIVKGRDYSALESEHQQYCLKHGIGIRFTSTPKHSTTDIINEIRRRS